MAGRSGQDTTEAVRGRTPARSFFMALADQIEELEAILDAGVSRVTTDGQSADYDLEAVRKRLAELRRQQAAAQRPRCAQINLGGF